jgi:monofunctional biosynthetic peptidoglycan transglycosylase
VSLLALRWINPVFTAVQCQRRVEAVLRHKTYRKLYVFVPLNRISMDFQHAVIAAEDGRFYQHHGIDWLELRKVVADDLEEGAIGRGGSTITQQLVKNLFLTTRGSFLRKIAEFGLAPLAEVLIGKRRILELYLNVIEWGPGIYGAEAAARRYYGIPASRVGREQGARLAAVIPSPRRRAPARMNNYAAEILERMTRMGW